MYAYIHMHKSLSLASSLQLIGPNSLCPVLPPSQMRSSRCALPQFSSPALAKVSEKPFPASGVSMALNWSSPEDRDF